MSMHLNQYSQKGCIGCKPCEGGGANVGRVTVLWVIGLCTAGIGNLIGMPFFKKCQFCGHNSFMNKHATPVQQYGGPVASQQHS